MQLLSGGTLSASILTLKLLGFPDTSEEVVESTRMEFHKVTVWVVSTASVATFIQLLTVMGRFINFEFASSHSSLIHVLVSILSTLT